MSGRKNILIITGFTLSVSLIASVITALLVSRYYGRLPYQVLNGVCERVLERAPESEQAIAAALKEYTGEALEGTGDLLSAWGYQSQDFTKPIRGQVLLLGAVGFGVGILLFALTFLYRNKREAARVHGLAGYLEQVNMGKAALLSASGEDEFSKLEDEIYKTVTSLYQTRDQAVNAKKDFAENLSNIAHQIKTPITAISLALQTMGGYPAQIQKQLLRMARLEEALLVLSRLDAAALPLRREEIDVFTVLVLAEDNLRELLLESGTEVDIPELGEMAVTADLDWTMEAVINLMKNCMEHNPGGRIHCSYGQNPLYTEILIWDEGPGFSKEDIPHLFERFYRGKNACEGGIGIGLALAKEIIGRQNGTIRARNRPEGGACFEIRFYSHGTVSFVC